jgi:ribosomal protein S18 acetylase RimI-like enzyme
MTFERMRKNEAEAVIALWQACGLVRPWNPPAEDIALALNGAASDILVYREEDTPVASVMVGHDGHRAWVYYLSTHPDHRRKGLARGAMAAAEAWARERGVPKVHLMVRPGNEAVIGFYEALGYEDGNILTMQKWIDPDRMALYPGPPT